MDRPAERDVVLGQDGGQRQPGAGLEAALVEAGLQVDVGVGVDREVVARAVRVVPPVAADLVVGGRGVALPELVVDREQGVPGSSVRAGGTEGERQAEAVERHVGADAEGGAERARHARVEDVSGRRLEREADDGDVGEEDGGGLDVGLGEVEGDPVLLARADQAARVADDVGARDAGEDSGGSTWSGGSSRRCRSVRWPVTSR